MPEIIELRGHHLLCMLTYKGMGYTRDFVANYDGIVEALNKGATIKIVDGVDSICGALRKGAEITCMHAHTCRSSNTAHRDRLALNAIARVLQIPYLKKGDSLKLGIGEIKFLRLHYLRGSIRQGCTACSWHDTCTKIARSGFKEVKLLSTAVPR